MVNYDTVIILCFATGAIGFILGCFVGERHSIIVSKMLRDMLFQHLKAEHELIEKGNKLSNSSGEKKDV